jgi:hypothetical protein
MLVAMPVTISGKTENGTPFEEKTRTVVVNGTGCKLLAEQTLTIGNQINVVIGNSKRSVFATVAWIGERKGKLTEAGVDFNVPDPTFWGVMFPEDPNSSAANTAATASNNESKAGAESKSPTKTEPRADARPESKPEPKLVPPLVSAPSLTPSSAPSNPAPSSIAPKPAPVAVAPVAVPNPAPTPAKPSAAESPAPVRPAAPSAPLAQAVKSASRTSQANTSGITAVAKPKISQVSPLSPPVVSALTPAMNPPPDPPVSSESSPAKLGPTPVTQGELAPFVPGETVSGGNGEPHVMTVRRPQISISDDGLKSLGGDLLLGMVQHLVREAFQEVLTQVLEDFDRYCTSTIERAKNTALAEMQERIRTAVTDALTPALEAGVAGARTHLDNAARQISMHHAKRLEASMQQALENTEKALETRVSDYDERLASTSQQFCQDLARRLHQSPAA